MGLERIDLRFRGDDIDKLLLKAECKWIYNLNSLQPSVSEQFAQIQNTGIINDNLSQGERKALNELMFHKELVIKPADKGGNVVILDQNYYISEAIRQLSDNDQYTSVTYDDFQKSHNELLFLLNDARISNLITTQEQGYLYNAKPKIPVFYWIPKIHKSLSKPPGHPMISGMGGPTEGISRDVDHLLQPFSWSNFTILSYLQTQLMDYRAPSTSELKDVDLINQILSDINNSIPSIIVTSLNTTTCATKCRVQILDPAQKYSVGDFLTVQVEMFDYLGQRKTYGGDFFRARIYSTKLKAGASGTVRDFNNGTYHVYFTLFWEGDVTISIILMHPSEGVSALWKARNMGYQNIYYTGKFLNKTKEVHTECGFILDSPEGKCEYSDKRKEEHFYCIKPPGVPCEALIAMKSNNRPHTYLSNLEKGLFNGSNMAVEIAKELKIVMVQKNQTSVSGKPSQGFTGPSQGFTGLHRAFTGLHRAFTGLHRAFTGLHKAFTGLHRAFTGLHRAFTGLHRASQGLHRASQGLHRASQGLHRASQGLHGASQGFTGPSQGFTGPSQGFTGPSQGLHRAFTGLHRAFTGLHRASQGLHRTSQGLHRASQGLHRASQGLHRASQGLHSAFTGLYRASQGLHRAFTGLHRTSQGLHRASQGFKLHMELDKYALMSLPSQHFPYLRNEYLTRNYTKDNSKCVTGMLLPFPSGYFFNNLWHPVFCNISSFEPLSKIKTCLSRKMIYLMGDSTIRQWIEFIPAVMPNVKFFDLHGFGWQKELLALDLERNMYIMWKKHGHPFVTQSFFTVKNHAYIAQDIDRVAGGSSTVIVIALGQHFRPFPLIVFIRRLLSVRNAIVRLFHRSPDTKVIIKSENTRDVNADVEIFSDFHGYVQYLLMKDIFQGLNVGVIDAWDMTTAFGSFNVHPPTDVIRNQINMFLTYICDL
ncbi:NXPE family member 1-like [Bombina bombina]|uniref:NXPE family member 1-like n=1 Tax=Bombina bombina TaxID=8345 RepID=UPI00235AF869|nr:NXPE family member 1-like [Bombina bombina]